MGLTPSQQQILGRIVDKGTELGADPDLIGVVADQAFYESSLGQLRHNPNNPGVVGLFQYRPAT